MTPREVEGITRLRDALRVTSDILDGILDDGLPVPGKSLADRDYYETWYERLHQAVKRSKEVLHDTAEYTEVP